MSADVSSAQSPAQPQTLPLEVVVLTPDFEIKGYVHVLRSSREDRRISDLLNNTEKRFLAITNAQLIHRHMPSSPRHYAFIQLHVDTVQMVHPSTQTLLGQATPDTDNYNMLRQRMTQT
jgi:hypothetical protein